MNISQVEIIAQKAATKHANRKLKAALIISAVYAFLYQFVFLRWEAPTIELYYAGVLVNTFALSVITGYIFYHITVPCNRLKKRCFPRAVPTEQAVNSRLIDGQSNIFQYGCLPILLCYLFEFYHAACLLLLLA